MVHSDMDPLALGSKVWNGKIARNACFYIPKTIREMSVDRQWKISDSSVLRHLVVRPCKLFMRRVCVALRGKCVPRQWMCVVMPCPSVICQLFVSFGSNCRWMSVE